MTADFIFYFRSELGGNATLQLDFQSDERFFSD